MLAEVLVVTVVGAGLVFALWPRPRFRITIVDGRAVARSGHPPVEFVDDVERLCRECDLPRVVVKGYRGASHMRIVVSRHVPAELHQRFRNVWSAHR